MIYMYTSTNVRHPVIKNFTTVHAITLHSTSLHLSTLHFLPFKHLQLNFPTLSFGLYLKKFRLKILFYFLSGCYVMVNLVTVLVLRYLKGISTVKITRPLGIPEDSNLVGYCMVLPGNWCSKFLEDHYSSCDSGEKSTTFLWVVGNYLPVNMA